MLAVMTPEHVLIIGGSSGIGLALAELLLADNILVTIAGRSQERLAAAHRRLPRLRTHRVDIGNEQLVQQMLEAAAPVQHIVVTAADATDAVAPISDLTVATARALIDTKLLGPWLVAKHAAGCLGAGSTLTFTSGFSAYRPGPGASMTAAVNGALEALARALALELAPARVNAVSPGWTDTPMWDTIAGEHRAQRLAEMAARLPVRRVGQPADVATAILALIRNNHITGTLLHIDGGQRLV
jgi:NAD(P)-dependent dehydrogenase (short-subunit alcohol dehydrogenase family)